MLALKFQDYQKLGVQWCSLFNVACVEREE